MIQYAVTGFPDSTYFNFNSYAGDSTAAGFTLDSTIWVTEGTGFTVQVRSKDGACYSQVLEVPGENLIQPVYIDTLLVTQPQCADDMGELTVVAGGTESFLVNFVDSATFYESGMEAGEDYTEYSGTQFQANPGTEYFVRIISVNGCTSLGWDSIAINSTPAELVIDTIYGTDPECIEGDGMVAVVVSGGYGGEYAVTVGGITETTVNDTAWIAVPAGSYTAMAVDSNMCSVVSDSTVVLTDPAPITFKIALDDVACADSTTGAIYVFDITGPADSSIYGTVASADTVIAGVFPTNDTIVFDGLPIGYYELWLNNENDACDSVQYTNTNGNVISIQAPGEIVYDVVIDTAYCLGDSSVITVTNVTGGSGTYSYSLNGVVGTESSWKVVAGSYDVVVSDAGVGSCDISWPTIVLEDPQVVVINTPSATVSPTCPGGNDGVINVSATHPDGGDLEYSLDSVVWYVNNIFAVPADTFTVYVRDAACVNNVASEAMVIVEPLDENIIALVEETLDTANECFGVKSSYVEVELTSWAKQTEDDDRRVTVSITDGADFADTLVYNEGTYEISNLVAGTYTITAGDNMGCVAKNELTVIITEEGQLTVVGTVTGVASCYGTTDGVMTIYAADGMPTHYGHANTVQAAMNLSDLAFTAWPEGADSVNIQVGKGTYYVVVKDACGAKAYDGPFTIGGLDMVTITDTAMSVTDIVCYGDSVGVIEVFPAEGGNDTFSYTLQVDVEGTWVDVAPYVNVSSTVFDGLPVGDYKVVVTDEGGCDGAETGVITVSGANSPVYLSGWYSSDITCYGASDGAVGFAIAGGTPPYEYSINGSTWIPFPDIAYGPGVASEEVLITEPGVVTVMVRDSLGCTLSEPIVYTIDEPSEILVAVDTTNNTKTCGEDPNGALAITVTGGRPGANYTVQVNDSILPSAADSAIAIDYIGLGAGDYKIIVTENGWNGCEITAFATITSPDTLTFDAVVLDSVHCKGSDEGVVVVSNIAGGTAPYLTSISGPVVGTKDSTATEITFSDLIAGEYEVTVEDALGCTISKSVTIGEPDTITLYGNLIADMTCLESGQFSVVAEGGSGEFMYYADNSVLDDGHIFVPSPDSAGWQMSDTFTVEEAGTYVIWVYDMVNGCIAGGEVGPDGMPVNEWRVKVADPDIVVDVTAVSTGEILCNGDMTDTIVVEDVTIYEDGVALEDPVYTVTINGMDTTTLEGVGAGTYVVVVTHEGGCYGVDTVVIEDPEVLDVVLDIAEGEFTCPGSTEGFIQATVSGGTIPALPEMEMKSANSAQNWSPYFEFQLWQDGELKTDYVNYDAFLVTIGHEYQVVVRDMNGCTDTSNVITIDPVEPIEFELTDVTCSDDTMASVLVEVTGEPGRMFQVWWQQFEVESGVYTDTSAWFAESIKLDQMFIFDNENIDDIHYAFTVVDDKGCVADIDTMTFDQIITAPLEFTVTVGEADECSTEISVIAAGGVAPYTFSVNGVETTETTFALGGGTYEIAVMDAHQCMVVEEVELAYGISADTTLETYTGEAVQFVVEDAMLDTMLYAGEYSFYYDVDTACTAELNVVVTEKDRVMPVLDTVTPTDTIADNHAIFTIVFEDVVTFNDSVMGYLTVTQKDSSEATLMIPITADMVDGNTITVDYDYTVVGMLDLNTTYTVAVDSGVVMGDGLAWDGVTGVWEFTTGDVYPTDVDDLEIETLEFSVYPNPFVNEINIKNADKLDRVILSNIAGQRILDIEYPSNVIRTGNLVTGVYVVTLIADDEIVKSERIIKR
ncbi:T9SS type A sorting domain-containing protein [Draconibacterium sp. IB214405]|uniref:T9SS type A sorting domain-containing protein n=1 Tax=Draconibacterium sp. IB214405 TaxID=3097352 RepID=UPI002A15D1BF|nr:T9SS type A sorting domain-containing protein [Draconibacterium sp. IB214405]MDX8338699.1 T9SS type A sorting domain-containing protein [Draconibacterium sp. IB214405]